MEQGTRPCTATWCCRHARRGAGPAGLRFRLQRSSESHEWRVRSPNAMEMRVNVRGTREGHLARGQHRWDISNQESAYENLCRHR